MSLLISYAINIYDSIWGENYEFLYWFVVK